MKKVFLTAVAVVALGSFSLQAKSSINQQVYLELTDCDQVHFEAYIYASESLGFSHSQALIYAAGAHRACSQQ